MKSYPDEIWFADRLWPCQERDTTYQSETGSSKYCAAAAAILKIGKTLLLSRGWPISMQFGKLMQNSMPIMVVEIETGSRIPVRRTLVFENRK